MVEKLTSRHVAIVSLVILGVAAPTSFGATVRTDPGVPAAPQEAVPIFNGRNLDGWRIHGTELWYADNGELVCESGPDAEYGYLATEKIYKDFELTLEFKQEANGNSGVFFRSSLDGIRITGWQVEVAQHRMVPVAVAIAVRLHPHVLPSIEVDGSHPGVWRLE